MGLFSRKSRRDPSMPGPENVVVLCVFRDPMQRDPLRNFNAERAYAYLWAVATPPRVGTWAIVDGYDGPATVVVGEVGPNQYVRDHGTTSLESIRRLVPAEQLREAATRQASAGSAEDAAVVAWLERCRTLAEDGTQRSPNGHRSGFSEPRLPDGRATAEVADINGRIWWSAYKKAEDHRRPSAEVSRFKSLAQEWFRIRDQRAKADQLARVTDVVGERDLAQAVRDVVHGKDLGDEPGQFIGKPMWDWLRYAENLATANREDALALVYALVEVAERESKVTGREPAPAYTERAAILHRRKKEYAAEVAVIERWERACPPEKRGPGATQGKLAERLIKARALAAAQSAP
jgi:hypothetical protein